MGQLSREQAQVIALARRAERRSGRPIVAQFLPLSPHKHWCRKRSLRSGPLSRFSMTIGAFREKPIGNRFRESSLRQRP